MAKRIKGKTKDGRHLFKWLTYDGHKVRIDVDIVQLLTKMWKLGIRTTNSCQSRCSFMCNHKRIIRKLKDGTEYREIAPTKHCRNNVWLAFESVEDVQRLYNIVAEYSSDDVNDAMYHKMSCDRFLSTGETCFKHHPDGWAFSFLMRNAGVLGHWGRPMFGKKRSTREMWIDDGCEKNNFMVEPQITFPRIHLLYVAERLEQALKRKKK